jgi:hypothetical protein
MGISSKISNMDKSVPIEQYTSISTTRVETVRCMDWVVLGKKYTDEKALGDEMGGA